MSLNSLDRLLETLTAQPSWDKYQQYRALLQCWETVIEAQIVQQTRPLYIQRQVLWVATSSAVWAQQLSLQRPTLLQQLNAHLREPLVDIRFSSANWYAANLEMSASSLEAHPSSVETQGEFSSKDISPTETTPQAAFQRWANVIQARSQHLASCPRCHCPTPSGELDRWSVCSHCAVQRWADGETINND